MNECCCESNNWFRNMYHWELNKGLKGIGDLGFVGLASLQDLETPGFEGFADHILILL